MTRGRSSYGEAYWRGYERGVQSGHAIGYREGLSVLDDAWSQLVARRPWEAVDIAAARVRLAEPVGPGLTPRELRVRAAESWGLPIPPDLAATGSDPSAPSTQEPAALSVADAGCPAREPPGPELADDDDWAWAL